MKQSFMYVPILIIKFENNEIIITIPNSRPKWAKCIPVFRTKRPKHPTRRGGTYPFSLHKRVQAPGKLSTNSAVDGRP